MSKTVLIKPGTNVTINNLITMSFEQSDDDEILATFQAPEGVAIYTDIDGSVSVDTKSLSFLLGDGFRTREYSTIGELIGDIIDKIQESPERPLEILSDAAKVSPKEGIH